MKNGKIESFNGLRFIMMIAIIINHLHLFGTLDTCGDFFRQYFQNPLVAVNYFFLLSGFGMMYGNLKRNNLELTKPSKYEGIKYAIKHIKKIYPVYLATIIIGFLIIFIQALLDSEMGLKFIVREIIRLLANCCLIQSASGMTFFTHIYNGVSWFLSALFCIYIVSPFLIFLLRKISKSIITDLILVSVNLIVIGILISVLGKIEIFLSSKPIPDVDILVYGSPYIRVFYVLIGMNIAMIVSRLNQNEKQLSSGFTSFLEIIISIVAIVYYFFRNSICPKIYDYRNIIDIIIPCLILFVFSFDNGIISKFLQRKKMQVLGKMTMYLYLIHPVFVIQFSFIVERFVGKWTLSSSIIYSIISVTISFLLSFVCYKKLEHNA